MEYVYWISIDPVRRKIDPYPNYISQKLEKEYNNRDFYSITTCELGKNFFHASVHFHYNGNLYQTTASFNNMGHDTFKQPGFRSVKRIIVDKNQDNIRVYIKQIHGEWRLADSEYDSDVTFNHPIIKENLVNNEEEIIDYSIEFWTPQDLESDDLTKNIVTWEWCNGNYYDNLRLLSNDRWIPYLFYQNQKIETSFANKEEYTSIISSDKSIECNIHFIPNTIYANQIRYECEYNIKYSTLIRRRIINIAELQEKIKNFDKR